MYNFLVLGQVPGTGIVITFTMWMQLAIVVAGAIVWVRLRNRQPKRSTTSDTDFSIAL